MIVAMKKVCVLVEAKDADNAVAGLGRLGLLHVEHQKPPQGEDISVLVNDLSLLDASLAILSQPQFLQKSSAQIKDAPADWRFIAKHITDAHKRLDQLQEYQGSLKNSIAQWQAFGDFQPQDIQALAEKNIFLRFYQIPAKELKHLPPGAIIRIAAVRAGVAYAAVISQEKIHIPFKEMPLPRMGLQEMQARITQDLAAIEKIKDDIQKHACLRGHFLRIRQQLAKEIEFHEALQGMGESGAIKYVSGYVPYDAADKVLSVAREKNWGILVAEPSPQDQVPTLLRNPRWVSFIRPVLKLLEIIPGYRELDISPLFLLFLSLFFGMIIGDAGYGAVYFLLAFWLKRKFAKKINDTRIFSLIYIFSACAIFWGLLTGTVFGQEWYLKAGLKPFIPLLNDTKFLQAFCFFLGAFHLSLAHCWQAIRKLPSLTALSDAGWICVLWAAFFLAKNLILNDPFPYFGKWLIIAGLSLVVFFTSPQRNVFKMIGQGLGTVALSLMNNFTDVVSYVRLFAIGLAGVAIADTVNGLAEGLGAGNPLVRVLILFLGHAINIVLGPMSVLVHGIRLNVLEFSGHAGLSWSGVAYKPLKE